MKNEQNINKKVAQLKDNIQKIYCLNGKKSTHSCLGKTCQNRAFVCESKQCECRQQHKGCWIIQTDSVITSLIDKAIPSNQLENIIEQYFDKIIDQVSDLRDYFMNMIKQKCDFIGLLSQEKYFLNLLLKEKSQVVIGKNIFKIHQIQNEKSHILKQFDLFKKKIQNNFKEFSKQIKNIDSQFKGLFRKHLNINPILNKQNENKYGLKLFEGSDIIVKPQEENTMISFFSKKKIKSCNLLYKASENNFEVKYFHSICKGVKNTLTLVETEYGKKIGGFTPLEWSDKSNNYSNSLGRNFRTTKNETKGGSFIFSLSNKDKFKLLQNNQAIEISQKSGPCFGLGKDLVIQNRANKLQNSYANIGSSYIHKHYIYGSSQTYQSFTGNPSNTYNFKTKEWQVWHIEFDQEIDECDYEKRIKDIIDSIDLDENPRRNKPFKRTESQWSDQDDLNLRIPNSIDFNSSFGQHEPQQSRSSGQQTN